MMEPISITNPFWSYQGIDDATSAPELRQTRVNLQRELRNQCPLPCR